jgi:intracellular multiplication protein IcmQ
MPLSNKNDSVFNKKLIAILDKIIEKGYWEDTLFLQAAGKKLRELRERLKGDLDISEGPFEEEPTLIHRYTSKKTATSHKTQLVFILLYSAEGNNLKQWENIINSLTAHSMTRPIYKNETDVQAVIRNKSNRQNDAYIAFAITENDISPPFNNKTPVDRYGNELIVLKEGVIHPNDVEYFIHSSGRYLFQTGKLIRVEPIAGS